MMVWVHAAFVNLQMDAVFFRWGEMRCQVFKLRFLIKPSFAPNKYCVLRCQGYLFKVQQTANKATWKQHNEDTLP